MSYDDWPDTTLDDRRTMVRKTLRRVTPEELEKLGAERFPVATDPWYEHYTALLKQHRSAKFYRAETPEGAEIVYCRDTNEGVWFLPGSGMGIIQPRGLAVLAELVDAAF